MITLLEVFLLCRKTTQNSVWNVKNLVFMALLVAMQLVLTRVLVLDLGPYRIYCGNRMYCACRTVDGTGCRRSLRTVRRYCRMLSERLCGESVYYTGIHSLGRSSGPFQKILFKQIQKGEDRGDFRFLLSLQEWSALCAWQRPDWWLCLDIIFMRSCGKTCSVCDYDSDLLCTDLPSVFQSSDFYGGRATALPLYWKRELYKVRRRNFLTKNYIFDSPYRTWYWYCVLFCYFKNKLFDMIGACCYTGCTRNQ